MTPSFSFQCRPTYVQFGRVPTGIHSDRSVNSSRAPGSFPVLTDFSRLRVRQVFLMVLSPPLKQSLTWKLFHPLSKMYSFDILNYLYY